MYVRLCNLCRLFENMSVRLMMSPPPKKQPRSTRGILTIFRPSHLLTSYACTANQCISSTAWLDTVVATTATAAENGTIFQIAKKTSERKDFQHTRSGRRGHSFRQGADVFSVSSDGRDHIYGREEPRRAVKEPKGAPCRETKTGGHAQSFRT